MRQRSKHASESGGDIQRQVSLQQQTSVVQRQTSQVGPPYHTLIICTIVLGVANNPIIPSLLSHPPSLPIHLPSHPPSHHTFPSITPFLLSHPPSLSNPPHHTLPPVKPSPSHPPSITPSLTQAATPALKKQVSSKKQEEWDKEIPKASFTRLLKANAPEWWLIAIGVLAAMGNGSVFPIYSILFGEVLREFQKAPSDVLDGITPWAATFLALAAGSAIAIFFKVSFQHGMAGRVLQCN